MRQISKRLKLNALSSLLAGFSLVQTAWAGGSKAHPYRYSVVDMPVSLALGTVRTPEFAPKTHWYWIMVQVEKPLPFLEEECMMGVLSSPLDLKKCNGDDPLLRAEWTVWSEGEIVTKGASKTEADAMFTSENIFKFLGEFPAISGKKYVVEVKFTKDGTPLNVANPHLIVIKEGEQ